MQAAADFAQERHELQAVLSSGIFNRAPNLAHVLTYVCDKYFEGSGNQIKEYNIAVEALGRPAGFDQKRDSIVRVEAHQLRKRLREYYEAEGADHGVRIDIPPGQYAPRFVHQLTPEPAPGEEAADAPACLEPDSPFADHAAPAQVQTDADVVASGKPVSTPVRRFLLAPLSKAHVGMWIALALVSIAVFGAVRWKRPATKPGMIVPSSGAETASVPSQGVRILAGLQSGTYTDRFGRTWQSDRYFQGGAVFESAGHSIAAARDPHLFRSRREGAFTYDIPLPAGVYELRLYFAETLYGENNMAGGGETSRIFDGLCQRRRYSAGFRCHRGSRRQHGRCPRIQGHLTRGRWQTAPEVRAQNEPRDGERHRNYAGNSRKTAAHPGGFSRAPLHRQAGPHLGG